MEEGEIQKLCNKTLYVEIKYFWYNNILLICQCRCNGQNIPIANISQLPRQFRNAFPNPTTKCSYYEQPTVIIKKTFFHISTYVEKVLLSPIQNGAVLSGLKIWPPPVPT